MSDSETTSFKLYRMEDDRISGECLEYSNIADFKYNLKIDYKGGSALCFTINEFYTQSADKLEEKVDEMVSGGYEEIVAYNYPNIPVIATAVIYRFNGSGGKVHCNYHVSSWTMRDLIIALQKEDEVKKKYMEVYDIDEEEYKNLIDSLDESSYYPNCENYEGIDALVKDCVGDGKFPEIEIPFPVIAEED